MSDRSLDRMALVSKIMLDQRVIDLRKENDTLRLELFWHTHTPRQLRLEMRRANMLGPIRCSCYHCISACRTDEVMITDMMTSRHDPCAFNAWFYRLLADLGMTYIPDSEKEPTTDHDDVDAHLLISGDKIWANWVYGARLRKARTMDDPEVNKLKRLFAALMDVQQP